MTYHICFQWMYSQQPTPQQEASSLLHCSHSRSLVPNNVNDLPNDLTFTGRLIILAVSGVTN